MACAVVAAWSVQSGGAERAECAGTEEESKVQLSNRKPVLNFGNAYKHLCNMHFNLVRPEDAAKLTAPKQAGAKRGAAALASPVLDDEEGRSSARGAPKRRAFLCPRDLWVSESRKRRGRRNQESASLKMSSLRLALGVSLALAAAAAAAGSARAAPPACVVSAGARSFDLAELGGGGGAGGAPPLGHVSREAESRFWTYSFAACGDVAPLPTACAGAAPGSAALQQTISECFGLGAAATRTVAATATGVALSFSGGDGGRSSVVTVECADVARPQVVRWGSGAAPGSYTALVRARAGCALECARDAATGAVCGGAARGTCTDGTGGVPRCVCSPGFAGVACADIHRAVLHGDSARNNGANSRITLGAVLLVLIAALWACVLRFVKLKAPLEPRTAQRNISDNLETILAGRSASTLRLALSVPFALMGALFFFSGTHPTNFNARKDSVLQPPAMTSESPVPSRGRMRPASADSAENGEWVWTAVFRGNATRPPHLAEQWTSQVGQDRTIADIFDGKRGGFFLDLAANDATFLSNTLMLEQSFGWRGICVEANPGYVRYRPPLANSGACSCR